MNEEPKPRTYNAIVRSTDPWNWKADLQNFMLTPQKLNAHIAKIIEERKKKDDH